MGCKINGSGIKSMPSGPITLVPKAVTPPVVPDPNACPPPLCDPDGYSVTGSSSCSAGCEPTGLPYCPPDLVDPSTGERLCPPCIPPDSVMISATPRDPYYIDALAIAMDSGDGTQTIRVDIAGNIPLVRPLAFRDAALPGVSGVPNKIRADIETHELEHQAVNMYSTKPQENSERREVAVIDRFNNRWVIVNSIASGPRTVYKRTSPAYFSRGRGCAPWWKTGYPDGTASTGVV